MHEAFLSSLKLGVEAREGKASKPYTIFEAELEQSERRRHQRWLLDSPCKNQDM